MNLQELQTMAAGIKNETRVGGNTAERVGKAFECVADVIQQGVDEATIKLDDLNVFPTTPQEAINFVKNNGKKAILTVMDRDFSVGVLSIFADAQAQVLTEVFETRLTLDSGRFTKGHGYGSPKRYWRNYGIKQAYNGGMVKKQEWTDWKDCEDDTASILAKHSKYLLEIYDGSPNGEQRDLQAVVGEINSLFTDEFKRCLLTSFIDETGKRMLYYNSTARLSSNVEDWKKVGTGETEAVILPFDGYVGNATITIGSALNGSIVWDKTKKTFLCLSNDRYYANWGDAVKYGSETENGIVPSEGILFFHITKGEAYTWKDGNMVQLSGSSEDVVNFAKQKIQEIVDTAKEMKKGDKGERGEDGRIRLVNHGTSDTTFALTPNTMHVWGEVESLNLSLAPGTEPNILAEYDFQFTTPANKATEFQLQGVQWVDEVVPTIIKGKTYQGMVVNGLAILISN